MAIIGVHSLVYSRTFEQVRSFFRDVLGWNSVDAGEGWPIFAAPPMELAVHPADDENYHELYLMCDDLEKTIAELKAKHVACGPVSRQPYGMVSAIKLPDGSELGLYQPTHPLAIRI